MGKLGILGRHRQQVGRLLPLLPQRGAAIRSAAGQQQGPGCALPEPGGEHRGLGQLGDQQFVELVWVDQQLVERQLVDRLRQSDDDAVVTPHQLHVPAPLLGQPVLQGHAPRCVDLGPERAEHADPPVADLVPEPFDHDGAIIGQPAGGLDLVVEELQEVDRRQFIEAVLGPQSGQGRWPVDSADLADEGPHGPTQFERPPRTVTVPEWHLARLARRRCDHHPLVSDVLDPPGAGPQQEGLAGAGLVDHLLVELADPGAVGQEHPVEATVGDGAAAGHRQPLGPGATTDHPFDPIPDDPGPEFGELVGRVATGQQVEGGTERLVGQFRVVGRPPDHRRQVFDRPVVERAGGHDLLGQHVQRVAGVVGLLDQPGVHALHHHCGLDQVGTVLREELGPARCPDLVTGPPDPLQAPADRTRRLDLDHQIDGPHVDAELQRRGGDQALQHALLELVFDVEALLTAE